MAALLLRNVAARRAMRRERVFRDRTQPLDYLSDAELIENYRFRRNELMHIIQKVEDNLCSPTLRNHAIPVETKVLGTLRFLAKGSFYSESGQIMGVSKASQSRYIHAVIDEIRKLAPDVIKFPPPGPELDRIKQGFYAIAGLPNTVGAVDGTLIRIVRPVENEELFVCRKGYHSINCQAVCDSQLRFTNFVAKWPGSTHDSFMWNECALKTRFERGEFGEGSWMLGDSAYTLTSYMLTPYLDPSTRPQERYNSAQTRTRNTIERAFGVMKSRWRVIHKTGGAVQFTPQKTCRMLQAIAVLHNLAIDFKTPLLGHIDMDDDEGDHTENFHNANRAADNDTRSQLVQARFS